MSSLRFFDGESVYKVKTEAAAMHVTIFIITSKASIFTLSNFTFVCKKCEPNLSVLKLKDLQ